MKTSNILIKIIEIYIIFTIVPIVAIVIPQSIRYCIIMSIIGVVVLLLTINGIENAKGMICFLAVLLLLLFIYYGKWHASISIVSYLATGLFFWIPLLFFYLVIEYKNFELSRIKSVYILSMIITCITTIIGNFIFFEVSRELAGAASETEKIQYAMYNVGGYGFVFSCVIILPFLFYNMFFAEKSAQKWIYFIFIVLIYILVVVSQYSTALLLSVLILIISILIKNDNDIHTLIGVFICLMIFFLYKNEIPNIFNVISDFFFDRGMNQIADRMHAIAAMLSGEETTGSTAVRGRLYYQSWSVFVNSPIFGALYSGEKVGYHSELLDLLGAGGVIGFILFLFLISKHIKMMKILFKGEPLKYAYLSLAIFILLSCVDTAFTSENIGLSLFLGPLLFLEKRDDPELSV